MSDVEFEGQRSGEKVKLVFRRHVLTATKGLVFLVFMMALGMVPLFIWRDQPFLFWIFCVAVVIGLIGCAYQYMLWYFSFYIVTNDRIRQNTQQGLFKHTVVDLRLDKVQSIAYNIPGLFGNMFGYGTLVIQSQVGDMEITKVSKPARAYEAIQSVIGRKKHAEES